MDNKAIEKEIKQMWKRLRIPPHLQGYHIAMDCLVELMNDKDLLFNVVKGLYVKVAEKNSTTSSSVERRIRHMIEVGSQRGPEIWGETFVSSKPTNKEFLATILVELERKDG